MYRRLIQPVSGRQANMIHSMINHPFCCCGDQTLIMAGTRVKCVRGMLQANASNLKILKTKQIHYDFNVSKIARTHTADDAPSQNKKKKQKREMDAFSSHSWFNRGKCDFFETSTLKLAVNEKQCENECLMIHCFSSPSKIIIIITVHRKSASTYTRTLHWPRVEMNAHMWCNRVQPHSSRHRHSVKVIMRVSIIY